MNIFYLIRSIRPSTIIVALIATIFTIEPIHAASDNFTGTWKIDIRSTSEQQAKIECGYAIFTLKQVGNTIRGDHIFATAGCSRLNEGGDGSVQGRVTNGEAILFITSGRNGAVVRGKAKIKNFKLIWKTLEEIKSGTPDGDSPLILNEGVLRRIDK